MSDYLMVSGTATGAADVRELIEQSRNITQLLSDQVNTSDADVLVVNGGKYEQLVAQMEAETFLRAGGGVRQRATLGIMLKGLKIDAVMVGGPAAKSGKVHVPKRYRHLTNLLQYRAC